MNINCEGVYIFFQVFVPIDFFLNVQKVISFSQDSVIQRNIKEGKQIQIGTDLQGSVIREEMRNTDRSVEGLQEEIDEQDISFYNQRQYINRQRSHLHLALDKNYTTFFRLSYISPLYSRLCFLQLYSLASPSLSFLLFVC